MQRSFLCKPLVSRNPVARASTIPYYSCCRKLRSSIFGCFCVIHRGPDAATAAQYSHNDLHCRLRVRLVKSWDLQVENWSSFSIKLKWFLTFLIFIFEIFRDLLNFLLLSPWWNEHVNSSLQVIPWSPGWRITVGCKFLVFGRAFWFCARIPSLGFVSKFEKAFNNNATKISAIHEFL